MANIYPRLAKPVKSTSFARSIRLRVKRVALKGFYRRWLESDPQPIEHPTRILPHVEAVLELAEVFRQVLLRDPDVGSADRPFQDQPEDFDAVGMIQTAHIFLRPMADLPMGVSHGRQRVADLPFVGADMQLSDDLSQTSELTSSARPFQRSGRKHRLESFLPVDKQQKATGASSALSAVVERDDGEGRLKTRT